MLIRFRVVKILCFILLLIVVLMFGTPAMSQNKSYKDVYHYFMEFALDAQHSRIVETGFKDLCIGVQLYQVVDNSGNPSITIDELLEEIRWAKKIAGGNGSVGVFIYNDTTRVGYDADGVYRYYRKWEQRIPVLEAIAKSGIDYYLFVSQNTHYSSTKDITTFLLAQRGIIEDKRVEFGVYDGDGFRDMLDYDLLEDLGVSIASDIYMNWNHDTAFLRSPAGWDYDHLITYSWIGDGKLIQNKQAIDAVHRLLSEQGYTGYNLLSTYDYDGILPDWAKE
jgi:hypothetical protein